MKKMFAIIFKEKIGVAFPLYYVLLGMLCLFVNKTIRTALLFSFLVYTSLKVCRMLYGCTTVTINRGFEKFGHIQRVTCVKISVLANAPWLFIVLLGEMKQGRLVILTAMLFYFLGTGMGLFLGQLIKNELWDYVITIMCFLIGIQKHMYHEMYIRYFSPILLLENGSKALTLAGVGLIVFFCFFYVIVSHKHVRYIISIGFIISTLLILYSDVINQKNILAAENKNIDIYTFDVCYSPYVPDNNAVLVADMIFKAENRLNSLCIEPQIERIQIRYYRYFPWDKYNTNVFCSINENICIINYFTDSLLEMSEGEFLERFLYSRLDSQNEMQKVVVTLLSEEIGTESGNHSEVVLEYLCDSLIEKYGYCAAPRYCIVAEALVNYPGDFPYLYEELGKIDKIEELKEKKEVFSIEFTELLERIIR